MNRTVILGVIVAASTAFAQPSLTPPTGAITESGRFSAQIELSDTTTQGDTNSVFRIDQPGSYVLTSNLDVPDATIGIKIASSNVTIDLNGFTILGPDTTNLSVGISVRSASEFDGEITGVTVENGFISRCDTGVLLQSSTIFPLASSVANESVIRNVTVIGSGAAISVADAQVIGCNVDARFSGISGQQVTILDCTVVSGGNGISITRGLVSRCDVRLTDAGGGFGIRYGSGSASDSVVFLTDTNNSIGFGGTGHVGQSRVIQIGSLSGSNVGIESNGIVERCSAIGPSVGFRATGAGTVIRDCTARDTTTAVDTQGFMVDLIANNF